MTRGRFKSTVPSMAQAKRIAFLWSMDRGVQVGGYIDPTTQVLLREGWIEPNGETGVYPNGSDWRLHKLSATGLAALATYFIAKGIAHGHR